MGFRFSTSGTWTPVMAFGGASTGLTYTTQTGTYYQRGRLVIVSNKIVPSNLGSSTGALTITGFPFTSQNITNARWVSYTNLYDSGGGGFSGSFYNVFQQISSNATSAAVSTYSSASGAGPTNVQNTNCVASMVITSTTIYWS